MSSLVSIIIPCYNAEKYIAETIQSVINQTYKNWELIVVNDGSTDNSLDIIKEFVVYDSRISFIDKKNAGVSDTRNKGIEKAKGEYIAFLDADDVWNENNLEVKVNSLHNYNDCDYVFSNMYNTDENLNFITIAPKGKDKNILENFLYWRGDSEIIPGPCSNLLLRRKCIENLAIRFETRLSNLADQQAKKRDADEPLLTSIFAFYFQVSLRESTLTRLFLNIEFCPIV
ncbi:MAG TPA: glycosyltransferase [Vicingus sp.]|nr:glycosyltransferase [Vicingus sp.]